MTPTWGDLAAKLGWSLLAFFVFINVAVMVGTDECHQADLKWLWLSQYPSWVFTPYFFLTFAGRMAGLCSTPWRPPGEPCNTQG